jgi:hypothetical protein
MMPEASPAAWPVRVAPLGPVTMATTLWRLAGKLQVTVILKATFAFSLDDEVSCVLPLPIRRTDECARGVPSLLGASETAPRLLEADVVLHGHAYARAGTTHSRIRLALEREGGSLIDKTLLVYGNRRRERDEIKPFERMRIGYERALGGLDSPDNPIGVGAETDSDTLPNVVDPEDPKGRVAGFGPIPSRFPSRRKLRGKLAPGLIEGGIADYPLDFPWAYFQVSPADQRLAALHGDEWLTLEGLHPKHTVIRTKLPSAQAVTRIYARQDVGAPQSVDVALDTLHIECNEARCSLVWRGSFPVVSELAAEQLVIAGALQFAHHAVTWPATLEQIDHMASPVVDTAKLAGGVDTDLQRTAARAQRRRVTPAPASMPAMAPASWPGAEQTAQLSPSQLNQLAAPQLPGQGLDQTQKMADGVEPAQQSWESTDEMENDS